MWVNEQQRERLTECTETVEAMHKECANEARLRKKTLF